MTAAPLFDRPRPPELRGTHGWRLAAQTLRYELGQAERIGQASAIEIIRRGLVFAETHLPPAERTQPLQAVTGKPVTEQNQLVVDLENERMIAQEREP